MIEENEYVKPIPEYPPYLTFKRVRFKGDPEYNIIGKYVMPKDGIEKASGTAMFTSAVKLPGMVYAMCLTSPFAHAIAKDVDVGETRKLPGVVDILTFKDNPELARPIGGALSLRGYPGIVPVEACWEGQPWAVAVCAESIKACYEALKCVKIDYEELPFVIDQREAIKPDAPVARQYVMQKDNLIKDVARFAQIRGPHYGKFVKGDVEEGFRQADKIIEWELHCPPHIWGGTEP